MARGINSTFDRGINSTFDLWYLVTFGFFIALAWLMITLVHHLAKPNSQNNPSDQSLTSEIEKTIESIAEEIIDPVIPEAEPMAPENKYETIKDQTVFMVQQVNSNNRYLLLQANETSPLARARRYYATQTVPDPTNPTVSTKSESLITTTITGNLSGYKTEIVAPTMTPWSFQVFTEPGPGRIQWCVWTQARKEPNFVIRKGTTVPANAETKNGNISANAENSESCQGELGEILIYRFWAPDQLAPDLTWVRVERNTTDPNQVRYRLRPANQPLESDWVPQDRIVTPKFYWGNPFI